MNTQKYYDMEKALDYPPMELKKRDLNKYTEIKRAYNEGHQKITETFKQDLFKDLGIENNPKKEKLFEIAWRMGHGGGYGDVVCYAEDMVGLIK